MDCACTPRSTARYARNMLTRRKHGTQTRSLPQQSQSELAGVLQLTPANRCRRIAHRKNPSSILRTPTTRPGGFRVGWAICVRERNSNITALDKEYAIMAQADIGLIGLAVMGENLILNMESKGFTVACFNRTVSKVDDFVNGRAKGKNIIGCHSIEELVAESPEAPQDHDDGQSGQGRGRVDRPTAAAPGEWRHPHRRRQQQLPGHDPPDRLRREQGQALHRHRRLRRRGRRPARPGHHAGRLAGGLGARQAHLPEDRRPGPGRHALLRVDGRERRRPLRQDGPQRHRVRRHADDLRDLRAS